MQKHPWGVWPLTEIHNSKETYLEFIRPIYELYCQMTDKNVINKEIDILDKVT